MEESIIVFDPLNDKAYRMEEGKLMSLGKALVLTRLWKDVVYRIGERLFVCEQGVYRRIASNSRLIEFDVLPAKAKENVSVEESLAAECRPVPENGVGNMFVRHPGADEGVLPESLYRLWLQERQKAVVLPEAENAFLIDSDREFRLFMCENGDVPRRQNAPVSAISGNSFVWDGYGYVLSNQKFRLFPLKLIGVLSNYLMLMLGSDVYSLDGGGFHSLGAYPKFYWRENLGQMLMIATVEHGKMCYQLCERQIRNVCLCSNEDLLTVDNEHNVHHHYTIDCTSGQPAECHRIFRPDASGMYVEAKE